jgi:hypothetical protein
MTTPPQEGSPLTRAIGVVLRVIAAIVGIVLVVYVGRGIYGEVKLHQRTSAIEQQLARALRAQQAAVESDRDASRKHLRDALGEPRQSWVAVECSFSTRDAGWMPQSYLQTCDLRAYDVYPTTRDLAATAALLRTLAGDEIGVPGQSPMPVEECGVVTTRGPSDAGVAGTYALPATAPAQEQWPCNWLRKEARIGESVRTVAGERPSGLPGGAAVVVLHARSLGTHDLGCSPWGIIFCGNPLREPVLG